MSLSTQAQLLPLVEAIEKATGRRVHLATAIRWTRKGVLVPGGDRVLLRSSILGNRRMTCVDWALEFVDSTSKNRVAAPVDSRLTPTQHQKAFERADQQLAEALL